MKNKSYVKLIWTSIAIGGGSFIGIGLSIPSSLNYQELSHFATDFVSLANIANKTIMNNKLGITIVTDENKLTNFFNGNYGGSAIQGCGIENVLPYYYEIINNQVSSLKYLENKTNGYSTNWVVNQILDNFSSFDSSQWEYLLSVLENNLYKVKYKSTNNENYYVQDFDMIPSSDSPSELTYTPTTNNHWYIISWLSDWYPTITPLIIMVVVFIFSMILLIVSLIKSKKGKTNNLENKIDETTENFSIK